MNASCRNMSDVFNWSGAAPAVDPNRILRVHRYSDPEKVRPKIVEAAHQAADQIKSLASPVAAYRRVGIDACEGETLRLLDGTEFHCAAFGRLLRDCSDVVVFVLTLGPKLDEHVIDLMEEFEPLDALFMEAAGWLGIESSTRRLAADIGAKLSDEGLALSQRMGPGYSYRQDLRAGDERVGWPLEEQAQLFGLFANADLPVELMSSSAMKPKMSRSGLFGAIERPA